MIQPLWKMVWRFLKKLEIKPPYDPAIPLLGVYLEESKIEKDACTPMFIAALFTIAGEGSGNPLPHSCLENPMDKGAWYATVHGVTKSQHD